MKRILFLLLATVSVTAISETSVSAQERQEKSLSHGWEFRLNDEGPWREISLPHDFQIKQPWVAPAADEKADNTDVAANIKSRLSSRGFKEMGKGYYRYEFIPGEELKDKRLLLDFGGIMYTGEVLLNGEKIGGTDYGYVGFEIDVTDKIILGRKNMLSVVADTGEPGNSRWYTGGGLFRDVKLITTSKDLYFTRHPLYITTRENKFVNISAEYANYGKSRNITMKVKVTGPDGNMVYEGQDGHMPKEPGRIQTNVLPEIEIARPQLWDTERPNLYTASVTLLREDGTVADEVSSTFGIRTVEIGPGYGLKLNGKKVLLKGYANHHTLGALGAANYPRAIEKRLQLMKEFGINHIRTSHNPYSREFIELCDKYGILVVDELYDKWTRQHTGGKAPFEQLWQYDLPEWVMRDRNSPSVVLWSLGNELQQNPDQPFNDFGVTMYKLMKTLLHRYDSTRLVTVAMHPRYRSWETDSLPCELAKITDIQAYNYRYMYFPGDGRRFPWMTFYQSEASVSAMGPNYFEMNLDKVIGLAYWGAIDYLGESQGWPAKGWAQGVFDISLEPKPKAYFMKSFFKPDEPVVHIGVVGQKGDMMWNGVQTGNDVMSDHWNYMPGSRLSLITYTNADEVELRINGKSLGIKKNPKDDPKKRNQIIWEDVKYQRGKVEAIARTGGKVVATHMIETAGKAVKLVAVPDNDDWKADGMDLQHLRVYAVDSKGRRVYSSQDELTFDVEGDARIVAVTNGDINSEELNVQNHRRLWNGSAMVILRAGQSPSKITLKTSAAGFKTVVTGLETY
ncbi:MAG: DUF4982 domain-containing protein [Bacteroidales bacterium]|nr:DUF4982 domain-containing protein [Bacteroidales bacterium]